MAVGALLAYAIVLHSDNHKLRVENQKLAAESAATSNSNASKPADDELPKAQEALNAFLGVEEQNLPSDEGSLVSQLSYCNKQYPLTSGNSQGKSLGELSIETQNSPNFQKEQACEYNMVATYIDDIQNNTGTVTSGTYLNGILNLLQPGSY